MRESQKEDAESAERQKVELLQQIQAIHERERELQMQLETLQLKYCQERSNTQQKVIYVLSATSL